MLPGLIVSDRPVLEARESCGSAQSGPCVRGKRMKKATMSGSACTRRAPAGRRRSMRLGGRPMRLNPTIVATKIHTHASM